MKMLLCDNRESMDFMLNKYEINKSDLLIVTVSYQLYKEAEKLQLKVIWLDCNETIKISESVRLVKKINREIFSKVKKAYLAKVGYQIEGSGLEQNIADILYNYRLCLELFEEYHIDKIYLLCSEFTSIECEIIREIAKEKKCQVNICYGSDRVQSIKNRLLYSNTKINKFIKYTCYILYDILYFLKCILVSVKNVLLEKRETKEYELGMIMASDAIKHVNWRRKKVETYAKNLNMDIICMFTTKSYKRWQELGKPATMFDYSYLQVGKCIRAILEYYTAIKNIWKQVIIFEVGKEYGYLNRIIKHRILQHALISIPKSYIVDAIAGNFFTYNHYKVIETWLGTNHVYSRIAYYNTRKYNSIFYQVFESEETIIKNPVDWEQIDVNILKWCFCIGKLTKSQGKCMENSEWSGEIIYVEGQGWRARSYAKKQEKIVSILWAPSYPLRGYFQENAFERMNDRILTSLSHWDIRLYAKYHPTHPKKSYESILDKYDEVNVTFWDRSKAIEDAIEMVDIVITTNSSVINDAIKLGTPIIVIKEGSLLEMDKVFDGAKGVYEDVNDALEYIKKLIKSENEIERLWIEQNEKMIRIYGKENERNKYDIIVKKIKEYLSH